MEFVTYWFSADSPADFAVKSSATPKVGGDADSLSPVRQVGMQYEARDLCGKAKGSRGSSCVHQPPLLKPLSGRHSFPQVVAESWPSQVLLCVVSPCLCLKKSFLINIYQIVENTIFINFI